MLLNKVHSNYCKRVGLLYANFSLDRFCTFLLEHSLTSEETFSRFRSFLRDIYCSHSEVKLVVETKMIAAEQQAGTDNRVGSASGQGAGGPRFASRGGQRRP